MSLIISCTSCNKRLSVKDELAGKRVKCPQCKTVFVASVPDPKPEMVKAAAVPELTVPAAESSVAAPPLPSISPPLRKPIADSRFLPVACPECDHEFDVEADRAGKKVTCPECDFRFRAPESERDEDEDEDEFEDDRDSKGQRNAEEDDAAYPDDGIDWGEELLKEQEVPKSMRRDIRKVVRDDKIEWATRARMDLMLDSARVSKLVGMIMAIAAAILFPLCLLPPFFSVGGWFVAVLFLPLYVVLGIVGYVGVLMYLKPKRLEKNAATRPCFMIAGRRLIVHPGIGMDLAYPGWIRAALNLFSRMGRGSSKKPIGVTAYTYADLTHLHRMNHSKFPGAGVIFLGSDSLDRSLVYYLPGVDELMATERLIREKVLHPAVNDLLTGAVTTKEVLTKPSKKNKSDAKEDGEIEPPEEDIGKVMSEEGMRDSKAFRGALADILAQVPEKTMKKVKAELAADEEVLWIDGPAAQSKSGKGLNFSFGVGGLFLTPGKGRREPTYTLYAITNRRALLWASHDTDTAIPGSGGQRIPTHQPTRGPLSYYPTDLLNIRFEGDKRIPGGGSIVFKSVKKLAHESSPGSGNPRMRSRSSWQLQHHYFGIMRIRNVQAVARLIYDRLIAPCR